MKKTLVLILSSALWCLMLSAQQKADTVTNKTILLLKSAGLGTDLIKAKIQGSVCNFDLSTDGLIALKKAGVPEDVIAAMLNKNSNPQAAGTGSQANHADTANQTSPGIYYCKGNPCTLIELEASVYSEAKEGSSFLSAVTYGVAKTKMKSTVSGATSNFQIEEANPQFYMYFDKGSNNNFENNKELVWFSKASSPNEFMLIKFSVNKRSREVVTGSVGTYTGISSGIDDKYKVGFRFEKVSKGVYRVYTDQALEKGEYCFMYAGGSTETLVWPRCKKYMILVLNNKCRYGDLHANLLDRYKINFNFLLK